MATRPLTTISFRRDVKLFLTTIVGFFVTLVLFLVLLSQNVTTEARRAIARERNAVASSAVEAYERAASGSTSDLQQLLDLLRARYELGYISVRSGARHATSGTSGPGLASISRPVAGGEMVLGFDDAPLESIERRFVLTTTICIASAFAAGLLLLLYVPRITRPIEAMLDHAKEIGDQGTEHDEVQYVLDSFRRSIETMKAQESELQRLHDEQKRRADELERVTATLTRSLGSGFIAVDRSGAIVDINATAREILALDRDAVFSGQPISGVLGETAFAKTVAVSHQSERGISREEIAIDGVTVGLTTVPLYGEAGEYLGIIALFSDLTDVRQLEARLRELQTLAELGEMSAGIAHEFRNSLSTILGYLKLAQRDPAQAEPRVRSAEEEAVQLSRAVDALLSFARPVRLNVRAVELRELARDVVRRLENVAGGVEIEIGGEEVEVEADPVLVGRAIENVVRNAIDAVGQKRGAAGSSGPESGKIRVMVSPAPRPTVTISDSGIGVEPASTARLFLPFQSDKPGGMGLGLPFVRKIMLLHGGSVTLCGEPGVGATVTLEFAERAAGEAAIAASRAV